MPPAKSPLEEIEEKIKNEKQLSSIPVEKAAPLQDVASPVSTPTEEEKTDVLKEVDTEPKTDIAGLTGAIARPLSNLGAQMAVGGMIGSVLGGGINPATAAIGAGAAPIIFGVEDLTKLGVNYLTGKSWKTGSEWIGEYLGEKLTELGVEEADTAAEKIIGATTEGLFAGGAPALALKSGAKALKTLPKVKKTAEFLGEQPLLQTATGGAAALVSSGAEEAGLGGPIPALAGLAAGFAVPAAAKVKGAIAPSESRKALEAEERVRFVYQSAFKDEKAREEAIQSLRKSGNISDDDVKLMIGDITNNKTMLAFQQALEKSNQEVAQRSFENLQGVGKKISRGTAEVGAPVEDAKTFFLNRYNELKNSYKQTIQDLDVQGLKVTQELEDAKIKLDEAEKNLAAGKIDEERLYNEAKQTLDDAFDAEKSKRIETEKLDTNKSVADVIQKQRKFTSDYATTLFDKITDVKPFEPKTARQEIENLVPSGAVSKEERIIGETAQESIQKQVELNQGIPPAVRKIYRNLVDPEGNPYKKELKDVTSSLKELNAAISTERNEAQRRIMLKVKKALDSDLQELETTYPQIAEANKFYRDYYTVFKSGAAEKAFEEGASLTQILDKYSKSEDDLIRLRKSIEGDPRVTVTPQQLQDAGVASVDALKQKGFNEVDNWIVDSVVDHLKKPQAKGFSASKSIEEWRDGPGSVIFRAFKGTPSEAEISVNNLASRFRNLEESANSAKNASDELAKKKISQGTPEKDAFDEARNTKKEIDRLLTIKRKQVIDEFQEFENTSLNPANRFIEGNASEVVGNIMSNAETSESQMKRILDAAAKDPTGKATQGVLNAGRKWLNSQVRSTSLATTTEGLPDPVLLVDSLQADLGKMQALLAEGSPQRKTLELLYGKNSRELAALDKSRQIFDAMARKTTLSPNEILKKDVTKGAVADTLMSIGAIGFANVKGYIAWKSIDLIRKLNQRAKGDVDKIYADLLARSLTDPVIAENMIRPINQQTWPQTKRFLRNMGIQARATDFGLEEDEDEDGEENVEEEEEFPAF
jgi:hypothetical protein